MRWPVLTNALSRQASIRLHMPSPVEVNPRSSSLHHGQRINACTADAADNANQRNEQ
jgi:hypothetical protein